MHRISTNRVGRRQLAVGRQAGYCRLLTASCLLILILAGMGIPRAAAAGRTLAVNGSIQAAVDAAQPGDVLLLAATSYTEKVVITRAGRADAPIVLRGAGAGKSLLRGRLRILTTAAHWSIEDLAISPTDGGDAIRIGDEPYGGAQPHDIALRRLHLYGGRGYGVRVGNDVRQVLIEASAIHHFDAGDADAHGIGIMSASGVTVRGCDIHHNSGDAIQVNTPDYPGYGRYASAIVIEHNQLHESRENGLDIKSTRGLIARNNQLWGFQPVDSSNGMAIQVQYGAQQIAIERNQIWAAAQGIEITRGKKSGTVYPAQPQQITIAHNLLRDIGPPPPPPGTPTPGLPPVTYIPLALRPSRPSEPIGSRASGNAIVVLTSADVRVYNNTIVRAAGTALYLGASAESGPPGAVRVANNLLDGAQADLAFPFAAASMGWLALDYNHYRNGLVNGKPLAAWLASGYERHPTSGDPRIDAEYHPMPGSPLTDSGLDVGLPFTGLAPDRGWVE